MSAASNRKLAHSFKERLDDLGCPYTEDVDESWIMDLVFRPGEARIRLLQWLFSKYDAKLNDLLDPRHAAGAMKMDSRLQRLLYVASTLGLCKPDEAELIRGGDTTSRQVHFMDTLLDYVCTVEEADDPQRSFLHTHSSMALEEQFHRDCWFVDSLADQGNLNMTFCPNAKLLPHDIMKQIEQSRQLKGYSDKNKAPVPAAGKLEETADQLSRDLSRQAEILEQLNKEYEHESVDATNQARITRTLQLVMSELSQLVVGFSYCYENEMQPWCNKQAPYLGQLGQAFKRVHSHLKQFTTILSGFSNLRQSHSQLTGPMTDSIHNIHLKETNSKDPSPVNSIENFQQCIEILEQSIQRLEQSHMTSPNTTLNVSMVKME